MTLPHLSRLTQLGTELGLLRAFHDVLADAGYDASAVHEATRLSWFMSPEDAMAGTVSAAGPTDKVAVLVALFTLGVPVPGAAAAAALAPLTLAELESAGLLERNGAGDGEGAADGGGEGAAEGAGAVVSPFRIVPYEDLLLLADGGATRGDSVSALHGLTTTLALALAPPTTGGTLLDLGTGSGVQALVASRRGVDCCGVDVNPRALAFARVNAALNAVNRIEWLQGSWFSPIRGRRFERIVGNPPCVVSPDGEFGFRDSDTPGGELFAELCRTIPDHLTEDGVAVLIAEWPHTSAEDWDEVPRRWVAQAAGCDGIVICLSTSHPLDHAVSWNAPPARRLDRRDFEATVARWQAYYRRHGIGALSFGAVVLRRRPAEALGARPWLVAERASSRAGADAGRQVARLIVGNDYLRTDPSLLDGVFAVPDGLTVSHTRARRGGRWVSGRSVAAVPGELGVTAKIHPAAAELLRRCDGVTPLRGLVGDVGDAGDAGDAERATSAVRELLRTGLLDVAGCSAGAERR